MTGDGDCKVGGDGFGEPRVVELLDDGAETVSVSEQDPCLALLLSISTAGVAVVMPA
jgi:hypothetical protein